MSVAATIKKKLEDKFQPLELQIIDDSHKHEGHAGHDGKGESHFRVLIVSSDFEGLSRVNRQRAVLDTLSEEMKGRIHALSLKCQTPDERG